MKIAPQALAQHLSKGIAPIYHLFGAEVLIVEETLSELRAACTSAGFSEREKYHVEAGFDWNQLLDSSQALSLFATKKIIEVRMPNSSPGDKGGKVLTEYCQAPSPDNVLILVSGAIEKRAQNTKWFKTLDQTGVSLEAAEVKAHQIQQWIERRLQQKEMRYEAGVARFIADYVEGNLLAASQEINMLELLLGKQARTTPMSLESVQAIVSDQARFTNFAYVDACLAGDAARSVRVLESLKRDQAEPILLIWAIARETRRLARLASAKINGKPVRPLFQKLGIWSSRTSLMDKALSRHSPRAWLKIHATVAELDQMLKGQVRTRRANLWAEVESLGLKICGVH